MNCGRVAANYRGSTRGGTRILCGTFALGWANEHMAFDPALPFGGYKQSGVGREFGAHGMSTITEQKSLMMQL